MTHITIYADQATGASFKAIHGVNNGPVTYGSLVDVTDYYVSMGVPLVRLHDPNWPHPREVDIHIVFPDFDKDPADPASYNFAQTDEYVRTVAATGASIVFRLGESIEHTETKYFVHPPKDYEKWADVCIGIIKHYNQGWANGFRYGIEYWEIWNEPDYSVRMWSGTHEQYYRLYEVAAAKIKRFDPSLKVGGPAAAGPTREFVPEFLAYVRNAGAPLDFFSWHTYTADPNAIVRHALHVRELLDRNGFARTESHFNEWNYFVADFRTIWNKGNEYVRKDAFDRQKSEEGASFAALVLSLLQDLPVDRANYYDGQPTALFCGLFDYHGVPQKTYYAFEAFERLRRHEERLACSAPKEAEGLACLAGRTPAGDVAALISHFHSEARELTIALTGLPAAGSSGPARYEVLAIDAERTFERIAEGEASSALELKLTAPKHSVLYVSVTR
ncbi:hypothetical protein FE782_01360 [Paenibacillus antri]|uniref:Glycosyl hydrolases family 39 N-terminal catalytic domain-containing protein n=1 Tax=Paenibacillus antri TaxID=2582848 RepID=A0A5R9GHR6_9BACL|nr:hypothetical protein [Paenibacillus antri]TLS54026.1 hypothetical protein FE782_01360 [Paenibacillus antri]